MDSPAGSGAIETASQKPLKTKLELAHDLSNALEIVVQSSFLLGTLDLGESGRQWHKLLDTGVEKATVINQQLREALRHDPE